MALARTIRALEGGRVRLLFAGAASLVLHLVLSIALLAHQKEIAPPPTYAQMPIELHTVERPPVRPAAPPLEARSLPSLPAKRLARVERPTPQPPQERASQPHTTATSERPAKAPPAPIRIGVTLESTTSDGPFSAPVGNSQNGPAPERAGDPVEPSGRLEGHGTENYLPQAQVAELPVLLDEVKIPYPPKARSEGREGNVVLMIAIDATGAVTRVRKVSGAGEDLDQAAIAAVKRFRFRPALYAGAPVGTEIRYIYSFEIN